MNNNALLYHFDEDQDRVILLSRINKNRNDNCEYKTQKTILSYNDILNNLSEIQKDYTKFEKCVNSITKQIDNAKDKFETSLSQLKNNDSKRSNFFKQYYSDILYTSVISERNTLNTISFIPSKLYFDYSVKKSKSAIKKELSNIKRVVYHNSDLNNANEATNLVIRINKNAIRFKRGKHNEVFTIADNSLMNFFDDFYYIIRKKNLYVCECKHCKRKYIDHKKTSYCDSPVCQKLLCKPKKKKKKDKDKTIYELRKDILCNIRAAKKKLKDNNPKKATIIEKEFTKLVEKEILSPLDNEYQKYTNPKTTAATKDFIGLKIDLYKELAKIVSKVQELIK